MPMRQRQKLALLSGTTCSARLLDKRRSARKMRVVVTQRSSQPRIARSSPGPRPEAEASCTDSERGRRCISELIRPKGSAVKRERQRSHKCRTRRRCYEVIPLDGKSHRYLAKQDSCEVAGCYRGHRLSFFSLSDFLWITREPYAAQYLRRHALPGNPAVSSGAVRAPLPFRADGLSAARRRVRGVACDGFSPSDRKNTPGFPGCRRTSEDAACAATAAGRTSPSLRRGGIGPDRHASAGRAGS
jgi:hypothetical protein